MKITKFCIGKKKKYNGITIKFLWFKIERVGFGKYFLWRFEISNWEND